MPQSDGINVLKRIEFLFKGKSYKFVLNPEEYSQDEPNRVTVSQTEGGAWIDDFGAGLSIISFSGTTGFKGTTGFNKFKELRDLIRSYYNKQEQGKEITTDIEMQFLNYTDEDYWVVTPVSFKLYRSTSRPLMYRYEIQLICIRPAGSSSSNVNDAAKVSNPVIDTTNPYNVKIEPTPSLPTTDVSVFITPQVTIEKDIEQVSKNLEGILNE